MKTDADTTAMAVLKQAALRLVAQSSNKTRPLDLSRRLSRRFDLSPGTVRCLIKDLVADGQLAYTYEYGCSFLEISFQRPVPVTPHIVLTPPGFEVNPQGGCIAVKIASGAAFGCGRHASTRLALAGIDHVLSRRDVGRHRNGGGVLDVGTGSGVLVIAAVKLGIPRGIGIDVDPAARAEARANVRRNQLAHAIRISDEGFDTVAAGRRFSLITANLRAPSLERLSAALAAAVQNDGWAVLAGIRCGEVDDLLAAYGRCNLACRWQATEKNWAAVALTPVRKA
jgi:ribosomal protein L11 methyltransferase